MLFHLQVHLAEARRQQAATISSEPVAKKGSGMERAVKITVKVPGAAEAHGV